MRIERLHKNNSHNWLLLGRDDLSARDVNDANQYLVQHNGVGLLLDPAGLENFSAVAAEFSKHFDLANVEAVFMSHYDPDMLTSLSLWLHINPALVVFIPAIWESYIVNFGINQDRIHAIADRGGIITLGGHDLEAVPAHYLHSPGNLSLYDPQAKILFSGDIGAALLPEDFTSLYVTDFDEYAQYMRYFHRRWMSSNIAKLSWIAEVRKRDVAMICPQHGAIFQGDDVARFLSWFEDLDVGSGWGKPQ